MARPKCPECGATLRKIDDETYYCPNCVVEDDYDDDEGCRACGNPAYPDCQDSCPLFD